MQQQGESRCREKNCEPYASQEDGKKKKQAESVDQNLESSNWQESYSHSDSMIEGILYVVNARLS